MRCYLAALLLVSGSGFPALANDSVAELGAGGLVLGRTDAVSMKKEDLFLSPDKVSVDYVFENVTESDVETIVAFPLPDISGNPYEWPAVPDDGQDNFLDFEVTVAGQPVTPTLQQRAVAAGVDVTAELKAQNVPLFPNGDRTIAALEKVPQAVADDWMARGVIVIDEYDDGSGMKRVRSPFWTLSSTYWWRTVFPANREVAVSHRYKPSVGGSAGLNFWSDGKIGGDGYADYQAKYCLDSAFERAVAKSAKENPDGYPRLIESRLSYILTTGGNWATGQIGQFKLTVDKGDPAALVSFCGDGVRKTGPTTFEMTATDFYPARDIDILILKKQDWEEPAPDGEAAPDAGNGG